MEVITTHTNADFDTIASIVAARKLYPEAVVAFAGGMEKPVRNFFNNRPSPPFPTVKAGKIDLESITRLILIDTRQRERIGRFADLVGRPGVDIHIFDHHPPAKGDIGGSLERSEAVGATTTIMVDLLREKDLSVTPEEATVMMMGLYEDTGFLSFISTTVSDFHAAAWLLSKGADLKTVSDTIRQEITADEIELLNDLSRETQTHRIKGIDIAVTRASSKRYIADAAAMVHKLMDINNYDALFSLIRMESKIFLVARSRIKEVDAGVIAEKLGGGGHPTAASAVIRDLTLVQAEDRLKKLLASNVRGIKIASQIMSSPVKTIPSCTTADEAKEIMTKFNINVLPVMERERIEGLISRQDLGKALYHGLKNEPVGELMTADFRSIDEGDPLSMVEEIIIEENQKFLPVLKKGRLAGCITRTDLLRILHYDTSDEEGLKGKKTVTRNVAGTMKGSLPKWLIKLLETIGREADARKTSVYLVGGFVRDLLLGRDNLDIDIVVEGDGIDFAAHLAGKLKGRIKSHLKFGTAVIVLQDGFKIDIATARMEYYSKPAALPTIEAGPIKLDLYRRDFAVNSMAIRLNGTGFGELIDYFGGMRDLKEKAIRVLHTLSFVEDPTRAFRAVRLEQRLGFQIGMHSLSLIRNAARLDFFDKLSPSRIFNELKVVLMETDPLPALRRMEELDLLRFFHPRFKLDAATEKTFRELEKVMDWYDLLYRKETYTRWTLFLALLQRPLKPDEVARMSKTVGLSSRFGRKMAEIKELTARIEKVPLGKEMDSVSLYRLLSPLSTEALLFEMAVSHRKGVRQNISRFIQTLRDVRIETTGRDLEKLGIPPGPIYAKIRESLLEERLSGRIESRKDELRHVKGVWIEK